MNCKPSVIICTEAWLKESNLFININGYINYFNCSRNNKADGIVVYVLENLTHNYKIEKIGKTDSPTITLKNKKKITISPIHRSHNLKVESFSEKLFEKILKIILLWEILTLIFMTIHLSHRNL